MKNIKRILEIKLPKNTFHQRKSNLFVAYDNFSKKIKKVLDQLSSSILYFTLRFFSYTSIQGRRVKPASEGVK